MSSLIKLPRKKRPKQLIVPLRSGKEVKGRRDFFTYRDLGLKEATDGRFGATAMTMRSAMAQATGWHYHTCEAQITLCLSGWADLVFEDGTEIRIKAGDFQYIPGGVLHNEIATSEDLESIEISIPSDLGTVAVDPPAWWVDREASRDA